MVISMDVTVVGIALSTSAILSAGAAFLLGFYIKEWTTGNKQRTKDYRSLIFSLTFPAIIIGLTLIVTVTSKFSEIGDSILLLMSIIASLIPPIVFLIMILYVKR